MSEPVELVLVDEHDRELGVAEKIRVHEEGLRHRALSVYLEDDAGRVLLTRRAAGKYHSGGLWTNACCSHPRPGEDTLDAAVRRTREELGIDVELELFCRQAYDLDVGGGMRENEVTSIFVGHVTGALAPDPAEIDALRWCDLAVLEAEIADTPGDFTAWFLAVAPRVFPWYRRPR